MSASNYLFQENQEILIYLKKSRLFGHLPESVLQTLIPLSEISKIPKGTEILQEGQDNTKVYFLIRGSVSIYAGGEWILTLKRVGDIFGEMSIISNRPCSATVIADGPVNLFSLRAKDIGDYTQLETRHMQDILYRVFSMILTEKLSLTTDKAKKFEMANAQLHEVRDELVKNNLELEGRVAERTHELRELNRELKSAKDQADTANKAKTQFLANMSHEIRTPLSAIVGFAQTLLRRAQSIELPENFARQLKNIKMAGNNLVEIVNNVLDLTKIEAGKTEMSHEEVRLLQIVENIYHIHKGKAEEKNIDFNYGVIVGTIDFPEVIISDGVLLIQILTNLLSNAIKFTPENKAINVQVSMENEQVILIEVVDQGIGIAPEHLTAIFNSFEQGGNSITRKFGGTGLGLAITKKMVELMGGYIEVKSKLGEGSTFSVRLPCEIPKIIHIPEQSPQVLNHQALLNKHFLLVEDEPLNREVMVSFFQDLDLQYELAVNGEEAVQKAMELAPDLILMDIHMPIMDGLQATQKLRSFPEYEEIPIIALSADAFTDQKRQVMEVGFTDYITKPINFDTLIRLFNLYLH